MQVFEFHRNQLNRFDEQHLNLVYEQDKALNFIHRSFSKENILKQIEDKSKNYSSETRKVLVDSLQRQHAKFEVSAAQQKNLELLTKDNSFTITTGHQLSLFTGPLYFVVKILHVIKMCNELNAENPDANFIPVYWMASEDHDYDEIKSATIFNNKLTWETDQSGPVGKFDLDGLESTLNKFRELFREDDSEVKRLVDGLDSSDYASFMRDFVNRMFKDYGLIIVDGDDTKLKGLFAPVVEKELNESVSHTAVERTNEQLLKEGFKTQAYAREVNLFYMEKGIRHRIIKSKHGFDVEDKGHFTEEKMFELLDKEPELFSPNVILRPVYQEVILPNLVYVGGGGEIAYWLQLKGVFDSLNVQYPLIQIRNSVLWIDKGTSKKIEKIELRLESLFEDVHEVKKGYVKENAGDDLDFSALDQMTEEISSLIETHVSAVEENLIPFAKSEATKLQKQIDGIKSRLIRTSKSQHESAMKSVDFIFDRLFPNGSLQERSTNFFQFCADGTVQPQLDLLYSALNPFSGDFIIIREA